MTFCQVSEARTSAVDRVRGRERLLSAKPTQVLRAEEVRGQRTSRRKLAGLGYDPGRIKSLREAGVVS
jgi:hypothetical protein